MNWKAIMGTFGLLISMVGGVGFPAYTVHKSDQAEIAVQRRKEVDRAVKEQQEHDRLWRTLDEYKRHFELLDANLPAQQRAIARAVFARMQVEQDMQPVYEKAMPVITQHRMRNLPPVAADAPAVEKEPQ